jgi:hypothetical protein
MECISKIYLPLEDRKRASSGRDKNIREGGL